MLFTAKAVNNRYVITEWRTATEKDNDFFTVERSRDAQSWEQVGTVEGAGNSRAELSYALTDENPYSGVSYYRLKQTDYDGMYEYFGPVSVNLSGETGIESGISVYPNPVAEKIQYRINAQVNEVLYISITNSMGQQVAGELVPVFRGENLLYRDLSDLPPGGYHITVGRQFGNILYSKNVIKN